jgi:hypothetical protein
VTNEKGAMLGGSSSTAPTNLVIDNVEFHDVMVRGDGIHNECIMAHAPGITIRNSTFRACHTMDISLGRGDWWGQPPYGNVVLENNLFGHSVNGSGWHYYGLAWFVGKFENARVVNNTFENQVRMESQHYGNGPYSGVWANNIGGGWQCLPGVTYAGNVGKKCGASDIAVNPQYSCGPPACGSLRIMPVGWTNPTAFDFSLQANSPAVNSGSAQYAPSTDKRGLARDARPDAGALEYGAGPLGGGPGAGGGAALWSLRFAVLRPKVICRQARRGCPSSTKLRMRLGRPAKVTVAVQRVRKGAKPKRARRVALKKVRLHKAVRLRARGLRAGRYRVVVRAKDASGQASAPIRLRLRVR